MKLKNRDTDSYAYLINDTLIFCVSFDDFFYDLLCEKYL